MNLKTPKYITYTLDVIIILLYIIIGYLVIYCLIIEPNIPLHYYGMSDLWEFLYSITIGLVISIFSSIRSYIKVCDFYSIKSKNKKIFKLLPIVFFFRNYKKDCYVTMDEDLITSKDKKNANNIILGITIGGYKQCAYYFTWSYDNIQNQIIINKLIVDNKKKEPCFLAKIPIGKRVKFIFEYNDKTEIEWKIYLFTDGKFRLLVKDVSFVKNHKIWGTKINMLQNITLNNYK